MLEKGVPYIQYNNNSNAMYMLSAALYSHVPPGTAKTVEDVQSQISGVSKDQRNTQ